MEYDAYGRQIKLIEKNSGTTLYTYNAYGQLQAQTDSRSMTYNYTYDVLGRMLTKSGPDGVYNYSYINSGNGLNQLYSQSNPGNSISYQYTYDNFSRPIEKKETINGQQFTTTLQYDNYSNLIQQTYPGGFAIQNVYNTNGYQTQVKRADNSQTIWQADAMSPLGTYIKYTLGNGLQTQKDYTNFGLPKEFKAGTGTMYDLKFTFDPTNGNLTQRKDVAKNLTEDFTYGTDNLYRLKTSQIGAAIKTVNYTANGNILNKTDYGNYFYSGTKINAVTSVDNTTGIINATSDQVITYTPFSKTSVITENNDRLQYTYGPDYARKKSVLTNTGGTVLQTIIYADNYEKNTVNGVTYETHYINTPDGLTAINVRTNGVDAMYYVHTDHLGSITSIYNANGTKVYAQNFDAWGRTRNPATWTYTANTLTKPDWLIRGFTGHEHLTQFGLINMNGRMYDPLVGRMLSPDNYVQSADASQTFNRYSYVHNNPLKYTDPDGNWAGWDDVAAILIGGGINVAAHWGQITSGGQFHWDKFGEAFVVGAVAGEAALLSGGAVLAGYGAAAGAGGFIGGAAAGFVASTVSTGVLAAGNNFFFNDPISPRQILKDIAIGTVTGGVINGALAKLNGATFWNGTLPGVPELKPIPINSIPTEQATPPPGEMQLPNQVGQTGLPPQETLYLNTGLDGKISYSVQDRVSSATDLYHKFNPSKANEVINKGAWSQRLKDKANWFELPDQLNGRNGIYSIGINDKDQIFHWGFIPFKIK